MFRDPNDEAENPYDLLSLSPQATAKDVHDALPRFVKDRRNAPRIGRAQEALRRLKSPKERAALDVFYYPLDGATAPVEDQGPPDLEDLRAVPCAPPEELYTDLLNADFGCDHRPLAFSAVRVSDLTRYDGLEGLRLLPSFDR
jgi:hypothetical protein